jgi:hypothetical protein
MSGRKCGDRLYDEGKAIGEVVTISRDKAHAGGVAVRQDAEAIMLDLVNPAGASRRLFSGARQARLKARPGRIGAQTAPELTRY